MEVSINFANPIACYNNLLNKCAGKLCHVEVSFEVDVAVLRVLIDMQMEDCYSPSVCQNILNNTEKLRGNITVAFYILFGGVMSMRILSDEEDDDFFKMPKAPVYETVTLMLELEKYHELIGWNIKMLGRTYDIPRAVLLLTPFSYPTNSRPESFFCSQLIMYMIKEVNLLPVEDTLDIDHVKPDHVYAWLLQKIKHIKEDSTEENE